MNFVGFRRQRRYVPLGLLIDIRTLDRAPQHPSNSLWASGKMSGVEGAEQVDEGALRGWRSEHGRRKVGNEEPDISELLMGLGEMDLTRREEIQG